MIGSSPTIADSSCGFELESNRDRDLAPVVAVYGKRGAPDHRRVYITKARYGRGKRSAIVVDRILFCDGCVSLRAVGCCRPLNRPREWFIGSSFISRSRAKFTLRSANYSPFVSFQTCSQSHDASPRASLKIPAAHFLSISVIICHSPMFTIAMNSCFRCCRLAYRRSIRSDH